MSIDEAITRVEEELDECAKEPFRPFCVPMDAIRILLSGFKDAERCIGNIDTYMDLGSAKYIAKSLAIYKAGREAGYDN